MITPITQQKKHNKKNKLSAIAKVIQAHWQHLLFILLTFGLYFIKVFAKILFFKDGNLYAGHPNVWSDWALHITLTNNFVNQPINEWFVHHPYFAQGKLTYPFLSSLISAELIKLGLPLTNSLIYPSFILTILFLVGFYFFAFRLTSNKNTAVLSIFIFITSAGLGFLNFIKKILLTQNWQLLNYPPKDYTRILKYQWLAGNIPTAMLVPQRTFLLGITIGIYSLLLLLVGVDKKNKKLLVLGGVLAGILPIAHAHSFIAILVISATYSIITLLQSKKGSIKKELLLLLHFIIPTTIISIALYLYFIYGKVQKTNFTTISLGWTAEKNILAWLKLWWNIWGIAIPIAVYSYLTNYHNLLKTKVRNINKNNLIHLGFLLLFIISNIVIFQPTAWDNSKLFAWVYLSISILTANLVSSLFNKKSILKKILAMIIIILISSTGILELIRLQKLEKNTYLLSTKEDIKLYSQLKTLTPTNSIFLSASNHNHPVLMWGARPTLLGYQGWVVNFGFNIKQTSQDVKNIYQLPAFNQQLLQQYHLNYIIVGPREKREFQVDQEYFDHHYPVILQNYSTKIYQVN